MQHNQISPTLLLKKLKKHLKLKKSESVLKVGLTQFRIQSSHWLFSEEASNS